MPYADKERQSEYNRLWRVNNPVRMKELKERWNRENAPAGSARMSWIGMKKRCLDPAQNNYPNYGGRGITIDPRWMSFSNFHEDMGERPSGKTLDRIDVNGMYTKDNCQWATPTEQGRNKR